MLRTFLKTFQLRLCLLVAAILCAGGMAWGDELTFDFEDESAHRTSGNNSYTGTNHYSENGVDIALQYADAVTTGGPLNGSANIQARVAKNTGNKPTIVFGPIANTGYTITAISFKAKGHNALDMSVHSSSDNSTWTSIAAATAYTSGATATISNLAIKDDYVYIKFTISAAQTTASDRDMRLDDIKITRQSESATPSVSAPVISGTEMFLESTEVSISCTTEGAVIQYSTDGTNWTNYTAPFTLSETTTVQAKATKQGMDDSEIVSKTFTKTAVISVAEAIAATPASGTSANMYIRGKVSAFYKGDILSDGTNYRYYISDDGSTTNQLLIYKGKGLNNETFTDVNDLLIGDEVVICGGLTMFNNAPEVAANNYIVSLTRGAVTIPAFSLAAGTYYEAQTLTLTCVTEGATIKYSFDNSTWYDYTAPLTVSETKTIYAKAVKGNSESLIVSAAYTIKSPDDKGGPNNPFTVAEALAANPQSNVYVSGIICSYPSNGGFNLQSSGLGSYNISDDGNNANYITVYKGKYLNNNPFTSDIAIGIGDEVLAFGNIILYQNMNELAEGNYLVRHIHHELSYAINWTDSEDLTLFVFDSDDQATALSSGDQLAEGKTVLISPDLAQHYVIENISVAQTVSGTGVTVTQGTDGIYTFVMPAAAVTITASAKDGRKDLEFHFASITEGWNGTYNITSPDQLEQPMLMINDGAEINVDDIVYTSSDTNVATVNSSNGVVALHSEGTAVITASYPGNNVYKPWSSSYTIIYVTEPVSSFTWDLKTNSYDSATEELVTWTSPYATMSNAKGSSSTKANNYLGGGSHSETRFYKDNVLTISPVTGYKITSVELTAVSGYAAGFKGTWSNATTSANGTTVTVTPLDGTIAMSTTLSEQSRATAVKVNYVALTEPSIVIASPIDVSSRELIDTLNVSYINIADNSTAELILCDATGAPTSYDWLFANFIYNKDVQVFISANTGVARKGYFKVKVGDAVSNIVTINQAEFVRDFVILPYSYDKTGAMVSEEIGLTSYGLGSYTGGGPGIRFDDTADWLVMKMNEAPKMLRFDIKGTGSGTWTGTFKVQTSSNGINYSDLATYTSLSSDVETKVFTDIPTNVRYIKWIFISKNSGFNVALGNIYAGDVIQTEIGDVNKDGRITIADVTALVNIILGKDDVQPYAYDHDAADMNGDESITIADVSALVNFILNHIEVGN